MTDNRSHIVIRNIFEMLAYACKAINSIERRQLDTESFDTFEDLLAAILACGMANQIRRGLEHEYHTVRSEDYAIRGRLDLAGTAHLRMAGSMKASCLFDEFTPDTVKNRILVTAATLLVRCPRVSRNHALTLKRALISMNDIPPISTDDIDWERLRYHHGNGSYQLLMGICHMIITARIPTMRSGAETVASIPWEDHLPWIYEHFVLNYFRYWYPKLKPNADTISNGLGDDVPAWLPRLQTDITLRSDNRKLIIDTKCYDHILQNGRFGNPIMAPANRNQIYSYVMHAAYGTDDIVSGMLLYAQTDNEPPIHDHWQETGHDFYAWSLDLGQPFTRITDQLDQIAALSSSPAS